MRKYLYTTLFLTLLAQGGVMAQDNNTSKGGFFGKLKDTFYRNKNRKLYFQRW